MDFLQWHVNNILVPFSSPGCGAFERFVINILVNQLLTPNAKFEAAKRLKRMTNQNIEIDLLYHSGKR